MQIDNPTDVLSFHFLWVNLDKNLEILVWDSVLGWKA